MLGWYEGKKIFTWKNGRIGLHMFSKAFWIKEESKWRNSLVKIGVHLKSWWIE